ncbi:hypothetical protein [Alkalihalobacillus deserti]|uniref:hypothetical protein n=1 Tax=Alkalihalobacillus deserti TaxID=2879466 RepID=UPI001D14861C|nr:hypothetical protein [Alkalihalobacillus deserti]
MNYRCNVCGFKGLDRPQYFEDKYPSFDICSCCGFQSGFDDDDQGYTFDSYRNKWINEGAEWFDKNRRPKNWDLRKQLKQINITLE